MPVCFYHLQLGGPRHGRPLQLKLVPVRARTSIAGPTDFKGRVLGFYGEWYNELAKRSLLTHKLPNGMASMDEIARTSNDRVLVNKIRTCVRVDLAMKGFKLN